MKLTYYPETDSLYSDPTRFIKSNRKNWKYPGFCYTLYNDASGGNDEKNHRFNDCIAYNF